MSKIKILNSELVYKSKYINFCKTEFLDLKGNKGEWFFTNRDRKTNAVMIIAVLPSSNEYTEEKIVVTKEFRVPISDYEWGFPAGLINTGESVEDAARRELKEETGLDILRIHYTSPVVYGSPAICSDGISLVFVSVCGNISNSGHEDTEEIETFLMNRFHVNELLLSANKCDIKIGAKAWMILRMFASNANILHF